MAKKRRGNKLKLLKGQLKSIPFITKFFFSREVFIKHKVITMVVLIYVFSPFDLVPEAILGPIALFDDYYILTLLVNWAKKVSPESLKAKYQ